MSDRVQTLADCDAHLAQVLEDYLAALEAGTAPPRDELLARHPELAGSLDACLGSLDFIRRAARQPNGHESPAMDRLGEYRIVREVGRGGMGVVYEAKETSTGRRVAVKVLPLARAADPRQLQRFKNEAQAAALLHHAHIVPVLAIGCEGDVHYYVMEYIEGHSLAEILRELRRLTRGHDDGPADTTGTARELADGLASGRWAPPPPSEPAAQQRDGRGTDAGAGDATPAAGSVPAGTAAAARLVGGMPFFRSVAHLGVGAAEALEHAHQAGVIHRDIKPGNLLVDGQGHVWVTDFGLARFPNDASLTLTGDLVGTVRYMSPEQTQGKHAVVDPRTDVYALGVTVYELLTLQPAFTGRDRQELLRQILMEEPCPPRRLNRAVPAALETIVLKALAKDPAERYASAQDLADDLRRFLNGVPVRARRPTLRERLRKWARRHRTVVTSAVVILLLAVAALGAGTIFIARERDEAQRREQQARRAVDEMYTQVAQQWLHHQPHLEHVQRAFLQKALEFYEEFARDHADDPQARLEAVKATRRVADIRHKLGDHAGAETAYGQAIVGSERLVSTCPEEVAYRAELAHGRNNRGNLRRESGRLAEAQEDFRQAHSLFIRLAADAPNNGDYRAGVAGSSNNLGMVLHALGRPRDAEAAYRQALDAFTALTREQPEASAYQHDLAGVHNNLANLLRDTGRPRAALTAQGEALRLWRKLIADYPGIPLYRQAQAGCLSGRAVVLAALGEVKEAEQAQRQALALRQRLAEDFPRVPAYRQALASSQHSLGRLLAAAGRAADAHATFDAALGLRRQLVKEFPEASAHRQALADSYHALGNLLAATGQPRRAEQQHRAALALRERLVSDRPNVAELRWDQARSQQALGNALSALGQVKDAEAAYRAALALCDKLHADFPRVAAYQLELAMAWNNLGAALLSTGRLTEADKAHRQGLVLREKLAADHAEAPYYRFELAGGQRLLGVLLQHAGRAPDAERAYRQAIDLMTGLTTDFPGLPEYRWLLAASRQGLGELLTATGRFTEAGQAFDAARPLWERLAADFPAFPDYARGLADLCHSVGVLRVRTGRAAEAQRMFQKALALHTRLAADFPDAPAHVVGLAWLLATCPETTVRDPARAVALSRGLVATSPKDADAWATLGAAHSRAGDWHAAGNALQQAEVLGLGNPLVALYQSMAWAKQGDRRRAATAYRQARAGREERLPCEVELHDLYEEARTLAERP